jgi:hypothetical protein
VSHVVIRAEGLGKKCLIGHRTDGERYTALRDVLVQGVEGLAGSAAGKLLGSQISEGDGVEEF